MRDRDEDMVIMYADLACPETSKEKTAYFRVRIIMTGTSWRALYRLTVGGEPKSLLVSVPPPTSLPWRARP